MTPNSYWFGLKVMFLHLSVILFTGGCLGPDPGGASRPTPGDMSRSTPKGGVQAQKGVSQHALRHTPKQMATAAGGTHPTRMHSCR